MNSRVYNAEANKFKQKLKDFFTVYYDDKVARKVDLHPDLAIPMIREAIKDGLPSKERLGIYAGALRTAIDYSELRACRSDF